MPNAQRRKRTGADFFTKRRNILHIYGAACCSPQPIGHGQGFSRAAMNSRGERYPRALCGCTSL